MGESLRASGGNPVTTTDLRVNDLAKLRCAARGPSIEHGADPPLIERGGHVRW